MNSGPCAYLHKKHAIQTSIYAAQEILSLLNIYIINGYLFGCISGRRPVGAARYIAVGADTPMSDRVSASTERTASQAASRARESSGERGLPSLGSTWQRW